MGVLSVERRGSSNDLHDHSAGLPREPLGEGARPLLDGTAQLYLHQLSCAKGVVERLDERWRNPLRTDVHEGIEMVGLRPKLGALLSSYCHE